MSAQLNLAARNKLSVFFCLGSANGLTRPQPQCRLHPFKQQAGPWTLIKDLIEALTTNLIAVAFLLQLFLLQLIWPAPSSAQEFKGGEEFYIEAETGDLTQTQGDNVLQGDVLIIGAGVILTADRIAYNKDTARFDARGHVVLLSTEELLTGDRLLYDTKTKNFRVSNAQAHFEDGPRNRRWLNAILGVTAEELGFAQARKEQLRLIEEEKEQLQSDYMYAKDTKQSVTSIVQRYAQLLKQHEAIKNQPNPHPIGLPKAKRARRLARKEYWAKARAQKARATPVAPGALQGKGKKDSKYFRLEGHHIARLAENDIEAIDAFWSPCRCDEDETPDWGFYAARIHTQSGGYTELSHAVFTVKGLPVFYIPYLNLSAKGSRQSGFLTPVISSNSRSGNIYSQPIFFDIQDNLDATLKPEIFQNRGARMGLELRYKPRKYSGWRLQFDVIRDRAWIEEQATRRSYLQALRTGLTQARNEFETLESEDWATGEQLQNDPSLSDIDFLQRRLSQADYWRDNNLLRCLQTEQGAEECLQQAESRLEVPGNLWRGSMTWSGLSILAPRLTFASSGQVWSDNRYGDDLYVPSELNIFFGEGVPPAYTRAEATMHYDGEEVYIGAATQWSQSVQEAKPYTGKQKAFSTIAQTRMYSLLPRSWPVSLYGQWRYDYARYLDIEPLPYSPDQPSLGSGDWQRLKWEMFSPISGDTIVTVDQFHEIEARLIQHEGLSKKQTDLQSWRSGVRLQVPIKGVFHLGDADEDKEGEPLRPGLERSKYLEHDMNWSLTFSLRPQVLRNGPYGVETPAKYVSSDGPRFTSTATSIEESLTQQQLISMSTTHKLIYKEKHWRKIPGQPLKEEQPPPNASHFDRAEAMLKQLEDKVQRRPKDIVSGGVYHVHRYRRDTKELQTPLSFYANTTFNLRNIERRKEILDRDAETGNTTRKEELPNPWGPLNMGLSTGWGGLRASVTSRYDFQWNWIAFITSQLTLPSLYRIRPIVTYSWSRDLFKKKLRDRYNRDFVLVRERSIGLYGTISKDFTFKATLANKQVEEQPSPPYETLFAFTYLDRSDCWGLSFARSKSLSAREDTASYYVAFSLIFGGAQRALPNLGPAFLRNTRS